MIPALLRGALWLAALAAGWAVVAPPRQAELLVCVAALAGVSAWLLWRNGLAQSAPFRRSDVGEPAPLALGSDALHDIATRIQSRVAEAASFDAALHDAAHLLKGELGARDAKVYRVHRHGHLANDTPNDNANGAALRIIELVTLPGGFQVPCPVHGAAHGMLGETIRSRREVLAMPDSAAVAVVYADTVVAVLELTGIEIAIDAEPLQRALAATGRALGNAVARSERTEATPAAKDTIAPTRQVPFTRSQVRPADESQFHELGFDGLPHPPLRPDLSPTMLTTTVLDPGALARLAELDPTGGSRLLPRVFTAYLNSVARLRPQFLEARPRGDLDAIRHVAHTLKSSSASIGAIKLAALCAEIDTMIRIGDTADLNPRLDSMDAELQNVLQAVKQLLDGHP